MLNYQEKSTRSMSSSLPSRSNMEEQNLSEQLLNYTIFSGNIKNPPRMITTDDGSGTVSNPKSIIVNNRRRSESFAIYSQTNETVSSTDSFNDSENYINHQFTGEETAYFSPDTLQQQIYSNNLNVDKKIVLYKTEMCRTFEETGTCKYGIKCQFAHDPVEIRNIPRHPRYKTEICKTFWQLGNCPYGKRCCFIHTENELKESKQQQQQQQQQQQSNGTNSLSGSRSADIYGSVDLIIAEDSSILGEIQSQNTSRSNSPIKAAEDLKKSISNLGTNSIFNNLSISNLNNLSSSKSITERRRKSILNDGKIDELANLIGSNCSIRGDNDIKNISEQVNETSSVNMSVSSTATATATALSSDDPEFKTNKSDIFELWSRDSPNPRGHESGNGSPISINPKSSLNQTTSDSSSINFSKFALFDKSPGSRNPTGIWTNSINLQNTSTFLPSSQFYETTERDTKIDSLISSIPSGTSSSKSTSSSHQQLLIEMLNLLDSTN